MRDNPRGSEESELTILFWREELRIDTEAAVASVARNVTTVTRILNSTSILERLGGRSLEAANT